MSKHILIGKTIREILASRTEFTFDTVEGWIKAFCAARNYSETFIAEEVQWKLPYLKVLEVIKKEPVEEAPYASYSSPRVRCGLILKTDKDHLRLTYTNVPMEDHMQPPTVFGADPFSYEETDPPYADQKSEGYLMWTYRAKKPGCCSHCEKEYKSLWVLYNVPDKSLCIDCARDLAQWSSDE